MHDEETAIVAAVGMVADCLLDPDTVIEIERVLLVRQSLVFCAIPDQDTRSYF